MTQTDIEWATIRDDSGRIIKQGFSWNPLGWGCTNGCDYCYARILAKRFGDHVCDQYPTSAQVEQFGLDPEHSLCWNFFPHLHPERLAQATAGQKPRGIFVGSMGDMWDPNVVPWWRGRVFDAIYDTPQHTYWALTKRPQNIAPASGEELDNLWFGVSVTGQEDTWRIDELVGRVSARRFVSVEPMLGRVDLGSAMLDVLDWVIVGAMTGPGAVAPDEAWVIDLCETCREAGIPFYIKENLRCQMRIDWVNVKNHHADAMRGADGASTLTSAAEGVLCAVGLGLMIAGIEIATRLGIMPAEYDERIEG